MGWHLEQDALHFPQFRYRLTATCGEPPRAKIALRSSRTLPGPTYLPPTKLSAKTLPLASTMTRSGMPLPAYFCKVGTLASLLFQQLVLVKSIVSFRLLGQECPVMRLIFHFPAGLFQFVFRNGEISALNCIQ